MIWYGLSLFTLGISLLLLLWSSDNFEEAELWSFYGRVLKSVLSNSIFYLIGLIPYLLSRLIKSLIYNYHKNRFKGLFKGLALKVLLPIGAVWLSLYLIDYYRHGEDFDYKWDFTVENQTNKIRNTFAKDQKQRGIHVFNLSADSLDLAILNKNNFEWITFSPFIDQEKFNTPSISEKPRISVDRWASTKKMVDAYGFKVMLKPHIWLSDQSNGIWRSNIKMTNEVDWDLWFERYEINIIAYAELAEKLGFEQFCIGTELHTPVVDKPEQWLALIEKVKRVYNGKLTYAANWNDDLDTIPFWDQLDFIGIQAYFPIADHRSPALADLETGWQQHIPALAHSSEKYGKPILFTEIGYKSTKNAGNIPWEWNNLSNRFHKQISRKTQALCYEAFFNVVWQQPWFAGIHIWEWQSRGVSDGNNNSFTIEGKPALNIVAKGFK